jgi:predicted XRE-type DNA-binding protein
MAKKSKITPGSGNIFADLGFESPEQHHVKAHLVLLLSQMIEARDFTQGQAAARMGLRQPDVSKLLRGGFDGFSLERLLNFVRALGGDIEIKIKTGKSGKPGRSSQEGRIRLTT